MIAPSLKSFCKICAIALAFATLASTELPAKAKSTYKKSSKDISTKSNPSANKAQRATQAPQTTRAESPSTNRASQAQTPKPAQKNAQIPKPHAGFVGVELGISTYRQDNRFKLAGANSSASLVEDYRHSRSTVGANVGIVSGYRGFFASWFGLRAYANLNYTQTMDGNSFEVISYQTNPPTTTTNKSYDYSLSVLNYGANLDLLFNVFTIKESKLGIFAGGGVGGNTIFSNKAIASTKQNISIDKDALYSEIKDGAFTGLDAWVNCGFYGIFLKSHSIEVLAKIPFIPLQAHNSVRATTATLNQERSIHFTNAWNLSVRYVFAF